MHRRTRLLPAIGIVIVLLLSSIGVALGADEPITLEYWIPGTDMNRYERYQRHVAAFEQAHNVKVNLVNVPGDYVAQLQVAVVAGQAPDVATAWGVGPIIRMSEGALEPLDSYLEQIPGWDPSDVYAAFLETYQHNGKQWALPLAAQPTTLVWSNEAFNRAGLAALDGAVDEAVLREYSQKLTTREPGGALQNVGFLAGIWGGFLNWTYHWGGSLYDEATGEITLDDPVNLAALEWMAGFYDEVYGGYDAVTQWRGQFQGSANDPMYTARQGMAVWSHYHHYFAHLYGDDPDIGFTLPPQMGEPSWQPKGPVAHTDALILLKGSEHPLLAAKLIVDMTLGEGFRNVYTKELGYPSASHNLNVSAIAERLLPDWVNPKLWELYGSILPSARSWPKVPTLDNLQSAAESAMLAALRKEATPQAALQEADRTQQAMLDEVRARD